MVHRNALRAGLCCAALGVSTLTYASTTAGVADFQGFMQKVTGANSVTVGVGGGGQLVVTKPSAALGGTSGWSTAPNFGTGATSSGVRIGMSGTATIAGKAVPLTVASPISKAALGTGFGILVRSASRLAGPVGILALLADFGPMLEQAGIQANPYADSMPDKPFMTDPSGLLYEVTFFGEYRSSNTLSGVCSAMAGISWDSPFAGRNTVTSGSVVGTQCRYDYTSSWGPNYNGNGVVTPSSRMVQLDSVPANWEQVRPKFEAMDPLPSDVLQKQVEWARKQEGKNGIEPWTVEVGTPTVTSPSPALSPETQTQRSTRTVVGEDGRTSTIETTTTTTKTHPITIVGDKITVDPKTTTTTTEKKTDPDGVVTETTTTDETETETDKDPANDPPQPDLCEKNPDILACAKPELDTPDGEIPRQDKTITYQPEDLFGAGSCPADVMAGLGTLNGKQFKVWDWQKTCDYALPLRAIVIALATFAAFLIVMPGETRV